VCLHDGLGWIVAAHDVSIKRIATLFNAVPRHSDSRAGKMNHGIVCLRLDIVASSIWNIAMARGEFVAAYTTTHVPGGGSYGDGPAEIWVLTFVRSIGEPAVLDPQGFGDRPGFRHPTGEYARYEPGYNSQFCVMIEHSPDRAFLSLAVPASVDDEEAQSRLGEMYPAMFRLRERYWDQPHEKRTRRERRLRDVIGLITLREDWAFFISSFDRYTPAAIFLSDSDSDVDAVAAAAVTDGNLHSVIEKW
jgi:hypothetical protein